METTGEVAQAKAELVKATEAARMEVATRGMVSAVEVEAGVLRPSLNRSMHAPSSFTTFAWARSIRVG